MAPSEKSLEGYVVVAVDGSASSLEALRTGHRMAELLDRPLVAVNAWDIAYGLFPPRSWHPERDAQALLDRSITAAFGPSAVPKVETITVKGQPADSLMRLSRPAELLVIGSRGHSGVAAVMLGSVSAACVAHCSCPVLVVHEPMAANDVDATSSPAQQIPAADRIVVTP